MSRKMASVADGIPSHKNVSSSHKSILVKQSTQNFNRMGKRSVQRLVETLSSSSRLALISTR